MDELTLDERVILSGLIPVTARLGRRYSITRIFFKTRPNRCLNEVYIKRLSDTSSRYVRSLIQQMHHIFLTWLNAIQHLVGVLKPRSATVVFLILIVTKLMTATSLTTRVKDGSRHCTRAKEATKSSCHRKMSRVTPILCDQKSQEYAQRPHASELMIKVILPNFRRIRCWRLDLHQSGLEHPKRS